MNLAMRNAMHAAMGYKPYPLDLCVRCEGTGMARETRTQMKKIDGKLVTTALGSGCPVCHGTGRVR